jgi:hypothetical protein
MFCKDNPFVEKDKERILLRKELPNSQRVASDEARIIILFFFPTNGLTLRVNFYYHVELALNYIFAAIIVKAVKWNL